MSTCVARSTVASCDSIDKLLRKYHPPKGFSFPKREFGSKREKRSFCAKWCNKYTWLHYNVTHDATFRHVCMQAEFEKKFLGSTKREAAFIMKGFTYLKEEYLPWLNIKLAAAIVRL